MHTQSALPDASAGVGRRWSIVAGATLGMALGFGSLALTSVMIQPLEAATGWSRAEISFSYTLAALGMAIGGVFWGRVGDRFRVRPLLIGGAATIAGVLAALSQVSSLWQLYAAALALGVFGFACLYSPLLAVVGLWFERRRGLAIGIVTAGGALGQGLLPLIADSLIQTLGWRAAFIALGALFAALLVPAMAMVEKPRRSAAPAPAGTAALPLAEDGSIAPFCIAGFLCCACMGVPLLHLVSHVSAICGVPARGSQSLFIAMLVGTFARVVFGLIADRIGSLPSYALASSIQTATLVVFAGIDDLAMITALSAVFGFGFSGNMTCLILCVRDAVAGERFGRAFGIVGLVAWLGMGAGGYVGGLLFDLTGGYALSFLAAAAAGLGNLAVLAWIGWQRRRPALSRVAAATA